MRTQIDEKTIQQIAHLARLQVDNVATSITDMNNTLAFMDKLNELDTSEVEPLIFLTDAVNVFRPDEVKQEITQAQALQNAPSKDSDYFRVPKVIEQ